MLVVTNFGPNWILKLFWQGTSSDVPIYLQYEGTIKNLKLKKTDVIRVIKDIWRNKTTENAKV